MRSRQHIQFAVWECTRQFAQRSLMKLSQTKGIVDHKRATPLDVLPQRCDLLVGQDEIVQAGEEDEWIGHHIVALEIDRHTFEIHGDCRITFQPHQQLSCRAGMRVPGTIMLGLGEDEFRRRRPRITLREYFDGAFRFSHAAIADHVWRQIFGY